MVGEISLQKHTDFQYSRKGFCAIVNQILDIAVDHYETFKDMKVCINDPQVEKLFDCIKTDSTNYYDASEVFLQKRRKGPYVVPTAYNAHTKANTKNLVFKNSLFLPLLPIKGAILDEFNELYKKLIGNVPTLGIQIRGTDKVAELPAIPDKVILKKIDSAMDTGLYEKIFIGTDDIYYINLLKNVYGDLLIYNNSNIISHDKTPLHYTTDRDNINKQVLSDVYLLSKTKGMLYCFSNVSLLSLIMGVNNFKYKELLNE